MTHRHLPPTLLMLLLAFAPLAAAQEKDDAPEEGENAWVEDCPPDHMCAFAEEEPTYGECGSEVCATGPSDDDCKDCITSHQPAEGETCMDGAQEGEACRDDVQYMNPPAGDGENLEADPIRAPQESDSAGQAEEAPRRAKVPGPAAALALLAAGIAAVLALARRG